MNSRLLRLLVYVTFNSLNHFHRIVLIIQSFISMLRWSLIDDFLLLAFNFEHLQVLLLLCNSLVVHFYYLHFIILIFFKGRRRRRRKVWLPLLGSWWNGWRIWNANANILNFGYNFFTHYLVWRLIQFNDLNLRLNLGDWRKVGPTSIGLIGTLKLINPLSILTARGSKFLMILSFHL